MDIVFFVYGLAFFSMGLSLLIKAKDDSQFAIAKHLWLLIIFAFSHSLLEWIDLWLILHRDNQFMVAIRSWPLLISFTFLFEFGRRVLNTCGQRLFILQPILIYPLVLAFILTNVELAENHLLALDINTRYALGFPGSLLTGIAVAIYFRQEIFTHYNSTRSMRAAMCAISCGFIFYSIFTGLITPKSNSWLSSWLNEDNFYYTFFGIPVQLFRAACAISISLGMIKMLTIFNLEGEERLTKAFATVDGSLDEVKRLEQSLQKLTKTLLASEERLNRAQAVAGVGSWHLDIPSETLTWSDESYRIFGIPLGSNLTPTDFFNSLYPDDRDLVIDNWEAALRGAPYDIEHRIVVHNKIKWVREHAEILFDENYQPIEALGTVQDITSQKKYELALAKSQRRMFAVIDASPIAKALYDDQQNIIYLNPAAVRIFGYQIEDIPTVNDWWPRAYPDPEYRAWVIAEWSARVAKKRAGELTDPLEVQIFCKDGTIRTMQADINFLQDENENLNLVTLIDLTCQKSVANRLKTLFDVASDGIHILDTQGNIVEFNQSFTRMLGYTDSETARLNIADWDALISRKNLIDTINSLLKKPATFETKHRCKNGSIIDVEINAKGIELEGRTYLYASSRDISERKQMQRELLSAKERLEVAASAGVIGIWDLDLVHNQLLWDGAMYKLYGVQQENWQTSQESWMSVIHPEDKSYVEQQIQEVLQRGELEKTFEFRVLWPDGSIHCLKSASRIFYDTNGKALRAIGVNYDLTEQKNTERALIKARAKSDAANKAKSAFLANMSHEIRTPMNAVIGLTQLVLETELTALQRDYLSKLHNAANSLLGILNDILDYSKIEAGKLDVEEVSFTLAEIVENASGLFKIAAEEKGIELVCELDPKIPPVLIGDPLRLKQIINNLLSNSIKFTQHGYIHLTIKIDEQYENIINLKISIADSGIGMTPDQVAKLFTAFEQADTSMTRRFGGTGLGLAITKQLVEIMGGNIWVESTFGQGSTFTFIVPLKIASVWSIKSPEKLNTREQTSLIRGANILLVEDNPTNQLVACKILEKIGLSVTVANNGREGFEQALLKRYDAILMDLQMPEMDGIEATQRIRALAQYKDIPIIAMTAATMLADREASQAAGMNDFVSKPINVNELTDTLVRWIPVRSGITNAILSKQEQNSTAPFTIPELNLTEAVLRMGQDWTLLRHAIQGFSREFANSSTLMDNYINQGRWADARRLAHTLKGIAKTIGANHLSQISRELESELMLGRADSFPIFKNLLNQILVAIADL